MKEKLLQIEFFETYYYANVIDDILEDTLPYLRGLNDWYENQMVDLFLRPFPKWSVLHDLIRFIIERIIYEGLDDILLDALVQNPSRILWVEHALAKYKIEAPSFQGWLDSKRIARGDLTDDHLHDFHEHLYQSGPLDSLLTQLSNEVFFLLFPNRKLLANLNAFVAGTVQQITLDDLADDEVGKLSKDGVASRINIPEWVKRAVFFRDRGMCSTCNTDISGLVQINNSKHFDHIVPLANGGINDVTNIQLLCDKCNLKKGRKALSPSNRYEAWY